MRHRAERGPPQRGRGVQDKGPTMTTTKTNGATSAPSLAKPAPAPKPKVVGKLESIEVDVDIMLAALTGAPKNDETRYYLCGLYLHRTPDKFVRCVSTAGHRILA